MPMKLGSKTMLILAEWFSWLIVPELTFYITWPCAPTWVRTWRFLVFGSTHPHLWGKEPIGFEETDEFGGKKKWWTIDGCLFRSGKGRDDPHVNPFVGWPVIRCLLLLLLRKICLRIIMKSWQTVDGWERWRWRRQPEEVLSRFRQG